MRRQPFHRPFLLAPHLDPVGGPHPSPSFLLVRLSLELTGHPWLPSARPAHGAPAPGGPHRGAHRRNGNEGEPRLTWPLCALLVLVYFLLTRLCDHQPPLQKRKLRHKEISSLRWGHRMREGQSQVHALGVGLRSPFTLSGRFWGRCEGHLSKGQACSQLLFVCATH